MRGTFGNIRLRNLLAPGKEGNWTQHLPDKNLTSIYEAAMQYIKEDIPLIVLAGKDMAWVLHATGRLKAPVCSESKR